MRFENRESDRFWEVEQDGRDVVTRYGRIGRDGSERARTLPDVARASEWVASHVRQRVADGYRRVDEGDAELREAIEARLAEAPRDPEAAQVLADLYLQADDPRGELIAVQHALAHADADEAARLEARAIELVDGHWPYFWGKPGGYPWRSEWTGLHYLRYEGRYQTFRGAHGRPLYDKVTGFLDTWTDCVGPSRLSRLATWYRGSWWTRARNLVSRRNLLPEHYQQQVSDALGGEGAWRGTEWVCQRPPDVPRWAEVGDALEAVTRMECQLVFGPFRFTFPDTDTPLPYQSGAFQAGNAPLTSTFTLYPAMGGFFASLDWPFEDVDDPRFEEVYAGVTKSLGRVFGTRRWVRMVPRKDGRAMKREGRPWRLSL